MYSEGSVYAAITPGIASKSENIVSFFIKEM